MANENDLRKLLAAFVEVMKGHQEQLVMVNASLKVLRRVIASTRADWEAAEKEIAALEERAQKSALDATGFPELDALLALAKAGKLGTLDS